MRKKKNIYKNEKQENRNELGVVLWWSIDHLLRRICPPYMCTLHIHTHIYMCLVIIAIDWVAYDDYD